MSYAEPEAVPPVAPSIDPAELDSARSAAAAAERQAAIMRGLPPGVDLASPLAGMFIDSYKGDLTVEAIREAAGAVGLGTPAPAVPEADAGAQAELTELSNVREGVAAGGVLAPPTAEEIAEAVHPADRGFAGMREQMQTGQASREKASAAFVGAMISAAQSGDERAIFTGWTEAQLAGHEPIHRR